MSVRAYLSVVFVCPYEGKTNPSVVANLIEKLMEIGVDELSLGDTIGAATPNMVQDLLKIVIPQIGADSLALHFHDTRGMALANVLAGLDMGVSTYDASIGGLGGCPYAPGASGNLATEDLVFLLDGLGIKTGINLEKLIDCGQLAQDILGKELPGRNLKAELAKRKIKMREANSCQTC
jgi:hydroxymethylglutaryl-CoA lyase